AQIFEAIGLAREVVDVCFTGTPSQVSGLGWAALGEDALARHASANWPTDEVPGLDNPGYYRDLKRGGEYHTHNKGVVDALHMMSAAHLLQKAIKSERDDLYGQFAELVNDRPATELRDLPELVAAGAPIPVEQ